MKKSTKVVLGLATAWPLVYIFVFLGFIAYMVTVMRQVGPSNQPPGGFFLILLPLHLFTMVLSFALAGIYIANIFRNDRVAADKKALWAVVVFIGYSIAQLIYWYLYIWREPEPPIDSDLMKSAND